MVSKEPCEAVHVADVLRRAGLRPIHAAWQHLIGTRDEDRLQEEHVLPVVAEVVDVAAGAARIAQDVAQPGLAGVEPVSLCIARLDDLVQAVQGRRPERLDGPPDGGIGGIGSMRSR
jgi:hypothetical protein